MKNINVPVGISNFEKIRQDGYYYVDKTGLIKDMLKNKIPEVTLITRPRRFGKTLAMSMLASFFDIRRDSKKLFQGLNISKEQQLCNDWMNQYPTLFLSFKDVDGTIELKIPNKEIKEIFETTVKKWFEDNAKTIDRKELFDVVWTGNADILTKEIGTLLRMTISYHDYKVDFYHAFLDGIFAGAGYVVESNKEHGEGRSDIVIYDDHEGKVAIFEAKKSQNPEDMKLDCEKAIKQINEKKYANEFEDAYDEILCYGISFFKKRCLVKKK